MITIGTLRRAAEGNGGIGDMGGTVAEVLARVDHDAGIVITPASTWEEHSDIMRAQAMRQNLRLWGLIPSQVQP